MNISPLVVASAQIWLFAVTLLGFLGLLFAIILGFAELDETSEKLAYTLLGSLGTIVTQMAGYFYSRQRPNGSEPDTGDK